MIDVREEDPYAQSHSLWAANFPLSKLELDAWPRIPRRDTLIVVYGEHDGIDLAARAAQVLYELGYTRVNLLEGGLDGWIAAGGETFRDANGPSKSFGELVESERHTPFLTAQEVQALLNTHADVMVVDARRFDEYETMSIPSAVSVPGAELVLRVRDRQLRGPQPQHHRHAVADQRRPSQPGGGATQRHHRLEACRPDAGPWRQPPRPRCRERLQPRQGAGGARAFAAKAGVQRIAVEDLATLHAPGRTVYRFDVRTPEEFAGGHLPGFVSTPGGQLVQETDHNAPVRGARIVLAEDGARADMSASWLAQMGWETWVATPVDATQRTKTGAVRAPVPETDAVVTVCRICLQTG